jgi:hypothetical protein
MDNNISDIIANMEREIDLVRHDEDVPFGEKNTPILTKNNVLWLSLKQSYYKPVVDHFTTVLKEYTENDYFVFGKNTKLKKIEYIKSLLEAAHFLHAQLKPPILPQDLDGEILVLIKRDLSVF